MRLLPQQGDGGKPQPASDATAATAWGAAAAAVALLYAAVLQVFKRS